MEKYTGICLVEKNREALEEKLIKLSRFKIYGEPEFWFRGAKACYLAFVEATPEELKAQGIIKK